MGLFGNNQTNSRLLGYRVSTSIAGKALPIVFGTNRLSGNVIWTGDWRANSASGKAGKGKYGGSYDYRTAGITALCSGPIPGLAAVWWNQNQAGQTTNYLNAVTASSLNLTLFNGAAGQSPWSYLASNHPAQALGYSGIAYVANADWDLGSGGMFPNYSFEVQGFDVFDLIVSDADCSQVIYRLLTDPEIGAGFQTSEVDISDMQAYCQANNVFVSPVLDQQKSAAEWLRQLLLVANSEAVWSEGILKFRSRGDATATANGTTFTPNTTPVANLTDDDFKDRDEPVRIARPNPRDAYNAVTVNWSNRGNQYNTEPLTEQDQASIDQYGYRPASAVDALGICRADVAAQTAHIQLKRNLYQRTKYKFKLGFEYILLEPMDVVTLTCLTGTQYYQGLNLTSVRLISISEDADGYLDCEAEEMPQGSATPVVHPAQTGGAFLIPSNASPGDVNTPIFYEACYEMRQALYSAQYALDIALSGGSLWGGCTVWRSWDGTTYEVVGRQVGVTPMGVTTADSGSTVSVNLLESFASLSSVTLSDATNFKTLSVLGSGATAELISFQTATLTGPYTYNLTSLQRAVYQSPTATHSADPFFLVKNSFTWIYQAQDIGKTVYFKFTSFNQSGNAEQSRADVTAYPYTLTGGLSAVKVVTGDYTVQPGDVAVNADTSGGPITITLPSATATPNTTVVVTNVGSGTATISGGGAGVGVTSLTAQYQSVTLESTPSGWIQTSGSPPRFVDDETPTGVINGTNTTFTLAHAPAPALSLNFYRNGNWQSQGLEYTLSGATITVITTAPVVGEWFRASYRF